MKISDHLVQLFTDDESDRTVLTKECTPVNMRLYRANQSYRDVILVIVRYMDEHLRTKFDDYPEPRGIAAPNLGFPLRIIGYRKKTGENQFCLNPKITWCSQHVVQTQTNCGSLRLQQPANVERYNSIDLEYYDLDGILTRKPSLARGEGSFTIQHEVDQINGITIINRHGKTESV